MKILTEREAETFLEKKGFNVVKRQFILNKNQLPNIKLEFPWVMKISSQHIVHKAAMGGTKLDISNLKEAEYALNQLCNLNHCEGILVQKMINGEELILGVKETPEFGKVIMFGKGGSKVEQEKDVSFRILPINEVDAQAMIEEIKFYSSLKNKVDLSALKKALLQLAKLAVDNPAITELDINPLIANKKEAVVVDARIQLNS